MTTYDMSKYFSGFSHRFQPIGFGVLMTILMAWAWIQMVPPTLVSATEVPFAVEHLVNGNFDGAYSIASADLDGALQRGEIRETAEIAQWVIAYRTLRGLSDERQARR